MRHHRSIHCQGWGFALAMLAAVFWGFIHCGNPSQNATPDASPIEAEVSDEPDQESAAQIIVAYSRSRAAIKGVLFGIERVEGSWVTAFDTVPCSFGKQGFAPPGEKVEGDGKTPTGIFPLGFAFGYQDNLSARMDFLELTDRHYWISAADSPLYNQLVDDYPAGVYAEKMRRKDHLYKYGIVIEYNMPNAVKGKGSAIFIHVERKPGAPTAGCIAISEEDIKRLIRWIDPERSPSIIMGQQGEVEGGLDSLLMESAGRGR